MLATFVLETANAPGTSSTVNLAGPATGRVGFSQAFSTGDSVVVIMDDGTQAQWVDATFTSGSPDTLTIDNVIGNTAGTTSKLNFAGSVRVYCAFIAERTIYADQDGLVQSPSLAGLVQINGAGASAQTTGRNLLHNPMFRIIQRGAGPFTASGNYGADRWLVQLVSDTVSFAPANIDDTGRGQIGDEEATIGLNNVFTGNAAAGAYNQIQQRIENVRRLGGKKITISFWAIAGSGTPKLGVNIIQSFGTGGSPSAVVWATAQAVTLGTTWTRYQVTIDVPTTIGKTLGTNGDDYTGIAFWYSSGATNNAIAGSIGVQSGTISLWGTQAEVSPVATTFEKPDPQQDLANCQRFYQTGAADYWGSCLGGVTLIQSQSFPVTMKKTPAMTSNFTVSTNTTGATVVQLGAGGFAIQATSVGAAGFGLQCTFTASADL